MTKHKFLLVFLFLLSSMLTNAQTREVSGVVTDENNVPLPGVNITVEGTTMGTQTDFDGNYTIEGEKGQILHFSFVGFEEYTVTLGEGTTINITMEEAASALDEVVVVGYGKEKSRDVVAAISTATDKDLQKVNAGSTVSSRLQGQISGLSTRMAEGRPGSGASVQVRNMGTPLFVIDGVVKDEGNFNNLAPDDIKSINVLKGASAAVYGSRAANGVIEVTTKKGKREQAPQVNIDAYTGWQRVFRYPNNTADAYHWQKYAAEAQINTTGSTNITPDDIENWKKGGAGFESFNWSDFIFRKNAPQTNININVSGGGKHSDYYLSYTHLNQDAVFKQYNFNRKNLQANFNVDINDRLSIGMDLSGRIEERVNPGVPGVDDYFEPLFAAMRNTPMERPFANDNPEFLNDIGHNDDNAGLWTYELSGKYKEDWTVVDPTFHMDYETPLKGLTANLRYSHHFAHKYLENHEFTYDAYTYNREEDTYEVTGGSSNPWQERGREIVQENVVQGGLNYDRRFGKHKVGVTLVTEWFNRRHRHQHIHNVPAVNELDLVQPNTIDADDYIDFDDRQARIGYIGRFIYDYDHKYRVEFTGREDASWRWPPHKRWGFFPSVSVGWTISQEPFFDKILGQDNVVENLKFRASYGELGDDNVDIDVYGYVHGYDYPARTIIMDGEVINTSTDRGQPVTNISWFTTHNLDLGIDFSLWDGKLNGSIDYFRRKRTGLLAKRYDVLVPNELGYELPEENLESDEQYGGELELSYQTNLGAINFSVRGNLSVSRSKFLDSYRPRFDNSWDEYRNSREHRYNDIFWGHQVIGRFESQDEINDYNVNIDGKGNTTLLPGDFIYADVNGDGQIDDLDKRPIGYNVGGQPSVFGGLQLHFEWSGIDLSTDFSYSGMYSYNRNFEARWPFQNDGALLNEYTDSWHREDTRDPNSNWISGRYPPIRFNDPGHSNYNKDSDFWLINIKAFRMRTVELGYTLPNSLTTKINLQRVRFYINGYNLFSLDNVKSKASFLDPEVIGDNALQYPQNKFYNVGVSITL